MLGKDKAVSKNKAVGVVMFTVNSLVGVQAVLPPGINSLLNLEYFCRHHGSMSLKEHFTEQVHVFPLSFFTVIRPFS